MDQEGFGKLLEFIQLLVLALVAILIIAVIINLFMSNVYTEESGRSYTEEYNSDTGVTTRIYPYRSGVDPRDEEGAYPKDYWREDAE